MMTTVMVMMLISLFFLLTLYRNTYVNHWDRNSKIVSIEDPSLIGGGAVLKQHIWNAARDTIQQVC